MCLVSYEQARFWTKIRYREECAEKNNQAMKLGQVIVYNIRNIFPGKSYTKCGREAISRLRTI